jgi:outer membrane protein OmpA-like peptidoglycan-associated protein
MNKTLKTAFLAVTATALVASGALTSPAKAASPLNVTVSKTTNLARAGESVNVSITGIPSGQGVYVFQCASDSLTPRPWARSGDPANKCGAISGGLWLSSPALNIPPSTFTTEASSLNPLRIERLLVVGDTTYDCAVIGCSVFVMRDRQAPNVTLGDTTLDTIIPISFASNQVVVTPSPPSNEVATGGNSTPKLNKKFSRQIAFTSGSSKLNSASKSRIKNKIKDFRLASKVSINATAGMTPGASTKVVNRLAQKRANAIKKYLVANGVAADKITIKTKIVKPGKKPSTKVVATP